MMSLLDDPNAVASGRVPWFLDPSEQGIGTALGAPPKPPGWMLMDDISRQPIGGPQLTPAVNPTPTPSAATLPPTPQQRPSLMQRIQQYLMPDPAGMQGMVSDSDVASARQRGLLDFGLDLLANSSGTNAGNAPRLGQALAHAVQTGRSSYTDMVHGIMQDRFNALGIQRASDLAKLRQTEATKYPATAGETPEQRVDRVANMAMDYANAGDPDTAGKLAELARGLREARQPANRFQAVQSGDAIYTFDPTTGAYVKGPDRGVPKEKLADDAANRALRELALKQGMQEFQIRGAETASRAFANQNKSLTDASNLYTAAKAAIAEARQGNPAALKSAILNYAAAADSKAQLRMGTINFVKNIDPSFTGNLQATMARLTSGKLPPQQLDMMDQLLDHLHGDQAATYERRRQGVIGRNPLAEAYIAPTEEIFGSAPAAAASTPATGQYSPNNPFAKGGKP